MPTRLCRIADCNGVHYAKGLCKYHYGSSRPRVRPQRPKCELDWCVNPRNGAHYCKAHEDHIKSGKEPAPLQPRHAVVNGEKFCATCERTLPVSMFGRNGSGVHSKCKDCISVSNRMRLYGISAQVVAELLKRPCEVCGATEQGKRVHVDHDHQSGVVRGVLCHHCNLALGLSRERPEVLRKLADYIETHRG